MSIVMILEKHYTLQGAEKVETHFTKLFTVERSFQQRGKPGNN
jgi:hypothetical protein